MVGTTVTRADLADAVCREVGLSQTDSAALIETFFEEICCAMIKGETVKLASFATFEIRNKKQRIGRNPMTGEEAIIRPRRVISFRASHKLKQFILNRRLSCK